jgi:hypothetical protein
MNTYTFLSSMYLELINFSGPLMNIDRLTSRLISHAFISLHLKLIQVGPFYSHLPREQVLTFRNRGFFTITSHTEGAGD